MAACEVVITHRFFGSKVCGVETTRKIKTSLGVKDEMYVCEYHIEYFGSFLEREYTYHRMLKEELF